MSRKRLPPNRKPPCPTLWGSHGCKKAVNHSGDCICACNGSLKDAMKYGATVFTATYEVSSK